MGKERSQSLTRDELIKQFNKKYKGQVIGRASTNRSLTEQKWLGTGIFAVDYATGGGVPIGRITGFYGRKSCVADTTVIPYQVRLDGRCANTKGGTIERLWERFHGEPARGDGRGKYLRPQTVGAEFWAQSINEDDRIFYNRIEDVVATGEKECYEITTLCGESVIATADHEFYVGDRFLPLSDLQPGQSVWVHNNTPWRGRGAGVANKRKYLYVQHHPVAGIKVTRGSSVGQGEYVYRRLALARGIIEAEMNGLGLEEYVQRLNSGQLEGLRFLAREDHVHHVDEVVTNDARDNLVVLSASEHGILHATERHLGLKHVAVPAVIASIVPVGVRRTYDLKMAGPFHTFVADRFVVHNCGKTSLALRAIAASQRYCRQCQTPMVELPKKTYRCLGCGYRGDSEGDLCPDCKEQGLENPLVDAGDHAYECAACKTYEPMETLYLDAEGTWDNRWAALQGVNCHHVFIARVECAEQAGDIADQMLRCGECDLLVIDTLAHLTPTIEIEESLEKNQMGVQARVTNKILRKIVSALQHAEKRKPTVIVLNQVRLKIGCFDYKTKVVMADGSQEWIGKIVKHRLPGPVLSYNPRTGSVEPHRIIGWHDNGITNDFLHVRVAGGPNGGRAFTVTPEHVVFTPIGQVEARSLSVGSQVLVDGISHFTADQHDLILGSILGDGSLRFEKDGTRGHLRLCHGPDQRDYCAWKAQALGTVASTARNGAVWAETVRTEELLRYKEIGKRKGLTCVPDAFVARINPRVAAIWYADDGNFSGSHRRWGQGKCSLAARLLPESDLRKVAEHFGRVGMGRPSFRVGVGWTWCGDESRKFQEAIAPYIPPSMRYKIKVGRVPFSWEVEKKVPARVTYPARVLSVDKVRRRGRAGARYDLTVEGPHTYLANGVVVHNCFYGDPETKPGGVGQDFVTSLDLKLWSGKYAKDDDGNTLSVVLNFRVVKNKCGVAQQGGNFRLWLRSVTTEDDKVHRAGDTDEREVVLGYAFKQGLFGESPKWNYRGEKFKNQDEVIQFVMSNPPVYEQVRLQLMSGLLGTIASDKEALDIKDPDGE